MLTLENKFQSIATGPVAALESIKHLWTNGGGFFGANSSMPFENAALLTNFLQILS
ncbi:potassium-transporting ATPase subunit KdpA, partial [Campylobacter jejuni]|nr:potassium-transporting ATPase subunit KdpA [Campylobacter jejuni]